MIGKVAYLAGPMRGYPRYNFDAFESACADLRRRGIGIVSPHEMDLGMGFNPDSTDHLTKEFVYECVKRDIDAIMKVDALIFLQGWEYSVGARAEKAVADWLGLPTMTYPYLEPIYAGNKR